jgi:hypothetical protein
MLGVATCLAAFAVAWVVHLLNRQAKREETEREFLDSLDYNEYTFMREPILAEPRAVVPYCGNLNQSMEYPYRCTRDMGHDHESNPPEERRHGYAGVFWD